MTTHPLHPALLDAYEDLTMQTDLETVLRRGQHLRHARRTRRTALGTVAVALIGVTFASQVSGTGHGHSEFRLAAVDQPVITVALRHAPPGLHVSTDLEDGRLRLLYVGDTGAEIVLSTSQAEPSDMPGTDMATLTYQHDPSLWVTLKGLGPYANQDALAALRRQVVDRTVGLQTQVTLAPTGWSPRSYKDFSLAGGGTLEVADSTRPDVALTVVLNIGSFHPAAVIDLEDQGPTTAVVIHGRPGSLVQGHRTWFLQAPLGDATWFTLMAPRSLTRSQVEEIAGGVTTSHDAG